MDPNTPFRVLMLNAGLAYAQAGVHEEGGPNRGPQVDLFQKYLGLDPTDEYSWCACFVSSCAMKALDPAIADPQALRIVVDHKYFETSAACEVIRQNAFRRGTWRRLNTGYVPRPGDLVLYDFKGVGAAHHIGIVRASLTDGVRGVYALRTVEGNTSASTSGSQDNGDGVYEKDRNMFGVLGYIAIPDL